MNEIVTLFKVLVTLKSRPSFFLGILIWVSFEYDVTINYLNTDELDDDGINKLVSSNEYFSEGFGTPLTLIVKNDEIVDKAVGETSKTDMVNMFKKNSIIK